MTEYINLSQNQQVDWHVAWER